VKGWGKASGGAHVRSRPAAWLGDAARRLGCTGAANNIPRGVGSCPPTRTGKVLGDRSVSCQQITAPQAETGL